MKSISTALVAGALAAAGALSSGIAGADPDPAPAAPRPCHPTDRHPGHPARRPRSPRLDDQRPASQLGCHPLPAPRHPVGGHRHRRSDPRRRLSDRCQPQCPFGQRPELSGFVHGAHRTGHRSRRPDSGPEGQRQGLLRRHRRRPQQHGVPNRRQRSDPVGGPGAAGSAAAPSPRWWVARAGERRQQPGACCTGSSARGAARAPRTVSAAVRQLRDAAARGQFRDPAALIQLPASLRA